MPTDAGDLTVGAGEPVLGESVLVLEPETSSPRVAREALRELLQHARPEWVDGAELAVSELVTNAVQHAHTQVELRAVLTVSNLRVEVRDTNPVMPVAREWGAEASTGRGMGLVAAVTSAHGVIPLQPQGKVVWFRLADDEHAESPDAAALLDAWDVEEPDGHRVVLRGFPPALWLAAREHHDAILRDLALFVVSHPDAGITPEDQARADLARLTVSASLDAALAEESSVPETLDLAVVVPTDRRACFPVLQDVLDEAERLAAGQQLLVRPALPEVVAVRDWVCEQVMAQTAGAPSTWWSGAAAPWFTDHVGAGGPPAWDTSEVVTSVGLRAAADDANRILAVSAPLAAAVGWAPEDLVGRRLVTLIPPRFREAHVAGFTRYLATGHRHVLGRPVDVCVLHADGHELPARLLIEERYSTDGRAVFVADLDLDERPT